MKNNPGFSLLELLIALVISAMIISGLFMTLNQVSFAEKTISSVTDVHQKAAILFNHLERDLMGAFIPEQIDPIKRQDSEKKDISAKPIEKIFWGKSREDKNLELITFVSNNPLEVYLGAKNSKPKTRIVRIVYRVEAQKGIKDSFMLTRQEGADLSLEKYKKPTGKQTEKQKNPAYQMIDGIASIAISYFAPDPKKEKDEDQDKKKYLKTKSWDSEVKQEKTGKVEYKLPEFVEVELVLWDSGHEKKFQFNYTIPIMFQKGKPKQRQSAAPAQPLFQIPQSIPSQMPMPQPTAGAQAQPNKPDKMPQTIAAIDGKQFSISQDRNGKFLVEQVPA